MKYLSYRRLKESTGWILAWTSDYLQHTVERIALNAKASSGNAQDCHSRMVAASSGSLVKLWSVSNDCTQTREIGMGCFLLETLI